MGAGDVAPIAVTTRSGQVESLHHGIVVTIAADGAISALAGDPNVALYPRSALKPLQAMAMRSRGLALDPERLAVACASHSGSPRHVGAVEAILAAVGLDASALGNTPDLPLSAPEAAASYLDLDHPLQRYIATALGDSTGGVFDHGVDGCGAPTAMTSLVGIVEAFRTLAAGGAPEYRAMTAHPELVAGMGRTDTLLMRAVPGLVSKVGAEGVGVAALPDGRAVGVKVADGAGRARIAALLGGLRRLGLDVGAVRPDVLSILGHGRPVGEVVSLVG
jgi:L-asparaginase II